MRMFLCVKKLEHFCVHYYMCMITYVCLCLIQFQVKTRSSHMIDLVTIFSFKTQKRPVQFLSSPLVQEQYTEHKSTISENSLPKLLFMGRFGLTQAMFEEGLQTGEFYEIDADDGKKRYAWTESTKSTTHGSSSGHKMEASKQLTKSQAAVENAKFATWSSNLFHAAFVSGSHQKALPPSQSVPLAICDMEKTLDKEQWEQAKSNLGEAMCAFEKLRKTPKSCCRKWTPMATSCSTVCDLAFVYLCTCDLSLAHVLRQSYICIQ